jgi:hypothetical protein
VAFSLARLTAAESTPSWRLSVFSTRAEHEPQVMPETASSTSAGVVVEVAVVAAGGRVVVIRRSPRWDRS